MARKPAKRVRPAPPSERGAPTLCTPELTKRICDFVQAGAPLPHACAAAGISWNTVKVWLRRGKAGEEPYATFRREWKIAKGKWVAGSVLRVTKAADRSWQAAAWLLERRVPEFRRPTQHEHTHKGRVAVDLQGKSTAELEAELGAKDDDDQEGDDDT